LQAGRRYGAQAQAQDGGGDLGRAPSSDVDVPKRHYYLICGGRPVCSWRSIRRRGGSVLLTLSVTRDQIFNRVHDNPAFVATATSTWRMNVTQTASSVLLDVDAGSLSPVAELCAQGVQLAPRSCA
jgi:hypothetical protein